MGIMRLGVVAVTCGFVASAGLATVVSSQAQQPGPPTGTLELMQRDADTRSRVIDFLHGKASAAAPRSEMAP